MFIHGRHDWASTLLSCTGYHRVQFPGVSAHTIASNYEGMLREAIGRIADLSHSGLILASSLPMCTVAGTQYDRLLREECRGKPAAEVPSRSLSGDWLDGYAATLEAVASAMDLSGGKIRPENVAVVGYFMDRCEGDHRGNVRELRRMLAGLGLDTVCVWLSGAPYSELAKVRNAGTILSLPHGRKAAAVLAGRLQAKLVDTDLPLGLDGTAAWLRQVAQATGRKEAAEAFIESELERIVPTLEWVVPHAFLNRRVVFIGDPYFLRGLQRMIGELGMELAGAFLTARAGGGFEIGPEAAGAVVEFAPRMAWMPQAWRRLQEKGVDLVVSNADGLSALKPACACFELGFPSLEFHCLREEPTLGFEGQVSLAHRMANALVGRRSPAAVPAAAAAIRSGDTVAS